MRPEELSRAIICSQQSDLWTVARIGAVTGSRLGDVTAPPITRASSRGPAGTEAKCREDYRKELVVERIYKHAADHYVTRAMQEGIDREPYARMMYEAQNQQVVELVGIQLHPLWDWFRVSADGLVGDDGGVELKSPTDAVHDSYVADVNTLVEEYKWQALGCLTCFPLRQWWDLASFSPYAPDAIKLVSFRFHRSDWLETIAEIEDKAQEFNAQIEAEIARRGLPPTVWDVMPQKENQ